MSDINWVDFLANVERYISILFELEDETSKQLRINPNIQLNVKITMPLFVA